MVMASVVITMSCNPEPSEYVEAVLDFNITLPEEWTFEKDYLNAPYVYFGYSPAEWDNDIIEGLWIAKIGPDYYTSLNEFYTQQLTTISAQAGYSLIWANDTTINGEPGKKLIHNQTQTITTNNGTDDYTLVLEKYFFLHGINGNNYGFIVNLSALDSTYTRFAPPFQEIISSFSFK